MATIGKDGKDDSARLASLGGGAMTAALASLTSVASASAGSRFFRASYQSAGAPPADVMARHVEFAEKMTLIGYVDAYGSSGSGRAFVVINSASAAESEAIARVSPLVIDAGAQVSIQALNTNANIWT